jgi:hypothetical protein
MSDVPTLAMSDGQSIELLSMQTMNEQHVELLPSRAYLDVVGVIQELLGNVLY